MHPAASSRSKVFPGWLEPLAWCAVALAVALAAHWERGALPMIMPDSTQYLSAARNLRLTHRLETSLVHFVTERSHGVIPAPLTTFAPGYSAAIAMVSMSGSSYEAAALWISMISLALVAGGIWRLVEMLDPSRLTARIAALSWITSSQAVLFSGAALSECLFTLTGLATFMLLIHVDDVGQTRRASRFWIGSAIAAGLSYWVRYAGILWVVFWLAILATRCSFPTGLFAKGTRPSWRIALASVASLALLVLPLLARNVILVGDWRGGNNTPSAESLSSLAAGSARILFHLVFGDATIANLWLPAAVAALGITGVVIFAFLPASAQTGTRLSIEKIWMIAAGVLLYAAGIAVIALRSPIDYSPRMYVPVLPQIAVLSSIGVAFAIRRWPHASWQRRASLGMTACVLIGYGYANWISRATLQPDTFQATQQILQQSYEAGPSVKLRLLQELKPGEVIAATNGQIAGYILQHPTLSLVGRLFGTFDWDEDALHVQMARFGATHLLMFRNAGFDPVVQESQFLSDLAEGHAPSWLTLMVFNPEICVYRLK